MGSARGTVRIALMSNMPSAGRSPVRRLSTIIALTAAVTLALAGVAMAARIDGTSGPDVLLGTPDRDDISGLDGGDVIWGLGGNDRLNGGLDDDIIRGDGTCPPGATDPSFCSTGGSGKDKIDGDSGNDHLFGEGGNDTIKGGADTDVIDPGDGTDRVDAGAGDDQIDATGGEKDTVKCGDGSDVVLADSLDKVAEDCEAVSISA